MLWNFNSNTENQFVFNATGNNNSLGGINGGGIGQIGENNYSVEDFFRDVKISILDMSTSIKDVRERLNVLESRVKVDNA